MSFEGRQLLRLVHQVIEGGAKQYECLIHDLTLVCMQLLNGLDLHNKHHLRVHFLVKVVDFLDTGAVIEQVLIALSFLLELSNLRFAFITCSLHLRDP